VAALESLLDDETTGLAGRPEDGDPHRTSSTGTG
jgi:hypothetical protein